MTIAAKIIVAAVFGAGISTATSAFATDAHMQPTATVMLPGKALEMQIGDKHSISYFEPADQACGLTVVIADSKGTAAEMDAHGTRIYMPVAPGKAVRIDGTDKKTAEFICGPKGQKMSARVYDREAYKAAKS